MRGLTIHAVLGLLSIGASIYANRHLYRGGWKGSRPSSVEWLCYAFAVVSVCIGWYFNTKYTFAFPEEAGWWHYTLQLFTTFAGGSAAQDLIITNLVLFPLWTIRDGMRSGLRWPWIYFVVSLFTSFSFGMGLYIATHERQLRWRERNGA